MKLHPRAVAGTVAAGLLLAACTGSAGVTAEDVRARAALADVGRTAVYVTLANDGDEDLTLVAASVPSDVAGAVELHEVVPVEDGPGEMSDDEMSDDEMADDEEGHAGMSGMEGMQMQEIEGGIVLPAGGTVTLEPGGLHIMVLDLAVDLADGDSITVTLEFDDGTTMELEAPVTANP